MSNVGDFLFLFFWELTLGTSRVCCHCWWAVLFNDVSTFILHVSFLLAGTTRSAWWPCSPGLGKNSLYTKARSNTSARLSWVPAARGLDWFWFRNIYWPTKDKIGKLIYGWTTEVNNPMTLFSLFGTNYIFFLLIQIIF